MTYFFQGDEVEPVQWRWIAQYTDGSLLYQYDDNTNRFHQFKEIDQSKLGCFQMTDGERVFTLLFSPGMKLIHFYRNIVLDFGGDEQRLKLYVFGYRIECARAA